MPRSVHTDAYASIIAGLVDARKAKGVTQVELAKRLGRPQSFISEIETRERRLDVLEFYALARALRIEPSKLFATLTADLPPNVEI